MACIGHFGDDCRGQTTEQTAS